MFSYLLKLLKRFFFLSDLSEKLNQVERKTFIYFLILISTEIIGFIIILEALELGFHWKYLLQI